MLIVMHHKAGQKQIDAVLRAVGKIGLKAAPIPGSERTAIGVLGNKGYVDDSTVRDLPGVRRLSMFPNRTNWYPAIFIPVLRWCGSVRWRSARGVGRWLPPAPVRWKMRSRF